MNDANPHIVNIGRMVEVFFPLLLSLSLAMDSRNGGKSGTTGLVF